ncbi:glycoside hydrolase family 9 protein [Opitutus sp. ER46]|uniref:glycoside hydrolase family 9 protein n=1 Tax=Opitutus sp. ER46 TaxID=2161864 RepID=UPI000D2F6468|nr:glycoside hydrolase family 9 protein [Opitutus sp. ER46]PTX92705.1 hypothetical protein DB354_15405 [Opitutus sp. ER46]
MIRFLSAAVALLTAITLSLTSAHAVENVWDYSVQVSSAVQPAPAKITLSWPQDTNGTPSSYTIYRKAPNDTSWGSGTTIAGSSTSYTDTNVAVGTAYEYRIVKAAGSYTGYGYIRTGIQTPLVENRGKVVLIVDNTFSTALASELARLQQDLVGDGWTVLRHDVGRNDSVASVKALIKADYAADPANVKSVFLFGHVPVPYSGQFNPDGHSDHIGAWPADVFYGDVDGDWTDSSVNYTQTINTDPADAKRISNVPGDGKFDQSDIPSNVELQVGRVDLANMPGRKEWGAAASFPTELDLMRKYLNKDHAFRTRANNPPRRAVLGDYFGARGGEAFGASGFRSFAPLVGASNIRDLNREYNDQRGVWIPQAAQNDYLLAYGCGAGSYDAVSGIGNSGLYNAGTTYDLVTANTRGVFNLIFGSWLGDWDHEDNFLRAPLATDSGLVSVWSGRPHWFLHPMGAGETIGYVAQLTQNNVNSYQTQINTAAHRTHIALMGDPTLRLHPVMPVSNLRGTVSGSAVALNWTAAADTNVVGYHVYRATSANGPFTRLTSSVVTNPLFTDTSAPSGATYMVRTVKLEDTTSGSYYNASQGAFWSVSGGGTTPTPTPDTTLPTVSLTSPSNGATVSGTAVTVSANASDNVGVTGVQFKFDGANLGAELTSAPYQTTLNSTSFSNGTHTITALARDAAGNIATAAAYTVTVSNATTSPGDTGGGTTSPTPSTGPTIPGTTAGTTVWIDDALPAGAGGLGTNGDTWNWVTSPTPATGTKAHRSDAATGLHEHWFGWSASPLAVAKGDLLFTYVYLDPANPPSEIMLSWSTSSSWEHRAYWGANQIDRGSGAGRYYAGALPATGQWVKLEVPASAVGLDASTVTGMGFSAFGGGVTWDTSGKRLPSAPSIPIVTTPSPGSGSTTAKDTVWIDDALPSGAGGLATNGDTWNWVSNLAKYGTKSHRSDVATGLHEHWFGWSGATLPVAVGDKLFTYVYLDPANPPAEIMISWSTNTSWEHRAYWGANQIDRGSGVGRYYAGALPATGQWVRLEVPASAVGMEKETVVAMGYSLFGGAANFDASGKSTPGTSTGETPSGGGTTSPTPTTPGPTTSDTVWIDDTLPTGAGGLATNGDTWNWVSSNPTPVSGTKAHRSDLATGLHEHWFGWSGSWLSVATGDKLFAYVYLDPANPPSEIMLSWSTNSSWEHRAYWGANKIDRGSGTGRYYAGALPATGKWVRLEVPASAVGLENEKVVAMGFALFGGAATWDASGKTGSTSSGGDTSPGTPSGGAPSGGDSSSGTPTTTPSTIPTDPNGSDTPLPPSTWGENVLARIPQVGDHELRVLSPTLLELRRVLAKPAEPATFADWNFVDASGNLNAPATSQFAVTSNGQAISVSSVGFRRRAAYAQLNVRDLRVEASLFLKLSAPITEGQTVEVKNPGNALWGSAFTFSSKAEALRFNPAIHVNQEGYVPGFSKKAMVGYYLGNLGEMDVDAAKGFKLVNAATGVTVYTGTLTNRRDTGYQTSPMPYQKVYEADFTSYKTPGEYQVVVPGMGASLPFVINEGVAMAFARAYELGLYHQRCGGSNELPYTRFVHAACHTAAAEVPTSDPAYDFTWRVITSYSSGNSRQTAPVLTGPATQLYPFVRQGKVDVSGGHHDAGDYSKYTIDVALLAHNILFAADSIQGAGSLDNLGIPESGDGIGDILQEAKWEADYVAKLQDSDGGFYFIVYPKNREYEYDISPEKGDQQVVWPKNTSATAASVAVLAEFASSPAFKKAYPDLAASYLAKAKLGWQFLMNAIAKYGKDGAYQRITFYGDEFMHDDELAWAAAAMFVATGEAQYQQKLLEWFPNPADPNTLHWSWERLYQGWGAAIRTYAFAARSGRLAASQLNATYLAACEGQITAAAEEALKWTKGSAYGTVFPDNIRRTMQTGWYFSMESANAMAMAYQINPKQEYIDALVTNMNYETGANPVNVSFIAGLGVRRPTQMVSQFRNNNRWVLPPIGQPMSNVHSSFAWLPLYGSELTGVSFPADGSSGTSYPLQDRFSDIWNVTTEFVTLNQGRALIGAAFLAAQTSAKSTPWKPTASTVQIVSGSTPKVGQPVTLALNLNGLDVTGARITWEARDQLPDFGSTYTITPKSTGANWVDVEIMYPDGRRVFATGSFTAQ